MKMCWKCNVVQGLEVFGKDSNRKDGKNPQCKSCVRASSAQYRALNPEKRKATCSIYREKNTEKCREAARSWYEADKDLARAKKRAYDARNNEQARARRAKWRSSNKEATALIKRARTSAPGSHSGEDIQRIRLLQRNRCAHCAVSIVDLYHVDHIVPIKLGGSNDTHNIQLLCPPCNLSKGAKHPILFAQESGRLL